MTDTNETEEGTLRIGAVPGPALSKWGRATILAATTPFGLVLFMAPWRLPLLHMALGLALLLLALAMIARDGTATPAGPLCILLNATYLMCIGQLIIFPEAISDTALVLALLPITMHVNGMLLTSMGSIYANMALFGLSSAPFLLFLVGPSADAAWTPVSKVAIALMGAGLAELFLAAASRQVNVARVAAGGGANRRQPSAAGLAWAPVTTILQQRPDPSSSTEAAGDLDGAVAGTAHEVWRPEMARMNRLLVLEALSATMAHEISQPINAAAIFIGATQRWLDQPQRNVEEAYGAETKAAAQLERARQIMMRIRRCAAAHDEEPTRVDINEAIAEVLQLMQHAFAARGVPLRFRPGHRRPAMVIGIRCELEQIIVNLLLNSLQAIPASAPRGCVSIAVRRGGDRLTVWVIDNGQGLPATHAGQLFDRFMTTRPEGTGLGLPISRQLAEKAGGRLALHDRRRGSGAVASLCLPAAAPADP